MQNDLDELKKNPLVLRLYKERVKLEHNGPRFRGRCPFGTHSDSDPSFDIFLHEGVYLFNCMGCGKKGNIFQFISTVDGIPMNDAIKLVRAFIHESPEYGGEQAEKVFKFALANEKPKAIFPISAIEPFERVLENTLSAQAWLLKERGITYSTAKRLRMGYTQDIGELIGKNDRDVKEKGWIVLPCIEGEKVTSIKFRSIARKVFRKQTGMLSEVLYNVDTIDPLEPVFLTEGEFDAAVLEQAGFRAVSLPNATSNTTPAMEKKLLESDLLVLAGDCDNGVGTEKMKRMWSDLRNRSTYLEWPAGCKDANETFLTECNGDVEKFREKVIQQMKVAQSIVLPGIYSLVESMEAHNQSDLANHPKRFRFPWTNVDKMAIILPGDVVAVLATSTKMGKTCWIMNATIHAAMLGETVLNYQCELDLDRFNTMVAAHVTGKDRNHLTEDDHAAAAKELKKLGVRYFVGSNPALNTVGPVLTLIEQAIVATHATVVVLDHIHFICRNEKDEVKAQADASQRIANMAKTHKVKFFMIEQPRKANQASRGKRLHISDGKGSEALHSDAAAIFAIHRDLVKTTDPPPPDIYSPITHVHLLGGARSKGDGDAEGRLMFEGKKASFLEVARSPEPGEAPGLGEQ